MIYFCQVQSHLIPVQPSITDEGGVVFILGNVPVHGFEILSSRATIKIFMGFIVP